MFYFYARVSLSCSFNFFSVARTLSRSFALLEVVSAFIFSGIQDFEDSISIYVLKFVLRIIDNVSSVLLKLYQWLHEPLNF
jgi:hypothetical protein